MKLDINLFSDEKKLEKLRSLNYSLPNFDVAKMKKDTLKNPEWVHFGYGNIFRAFVLDICQELLSKRLIETGIIAVESFDTELIENVYSKYDDLCLLGILNADGNVDKKLLASCALGLDANKKIDRIMLKKIFCAKSLKVVSFTVTEKAYVHANSSTGLIYFITKFLYIRYKNGKFPISLISMDNCSDNGDKLKNAILKTAFLVSDDNDFLAYLNDNESVFFPNTMIDKITPRPDETVKNMFLNDGFDGLDIYASTKNTYASGFVNSEKAGYLLIENLPANISIPIDKSGISGVLFADKTTIKYAEKMKVSTCLNPVHTALAIFGCLLGYEKISDEMKNPLLSKLVHGIGFDEGLKTVCDPLIISPKDFLDEVINERLTNPNIPDSPQRIACDTSQKLPIRFGETIKGYIENDLDITQIRLIPLVFAGWVRYLMAIDDNGNAFELSPDPELKNLTQTIKNLSIGSEDISSAIKIFKNPKYFGVNLYETSLGELTENYFREMIKSNGAVRDTLKKYC